MTRLTAIALFATVAILDCVSIPAHALEFALSPSRIAVSNGGEFTVDLIALPSPESFNGYDMVLGYDPQDLLLVGMAASQQEGALFTAACPQRFHKFTIAPDSSTASVAHVLLCAGVAVTGPGTLYSLHFRALASNAVTHLRLLEGTAAYDAGSYVLPFSTHDATVEIGDVTAAPTAEALLRFRVHPNPFNPSTTLSWTNPREGNTRVDLYTLRGRHVATLWRGWRASGDQQLQFSRDQASLPSGTYVLRLIIPRGRASTRVTLLK